MTKKKIDAKEVALLMPLYREAQKVVGSINTPKGLNSATFALAFGVCLWIERHVLKTREIPK